MRDLEFLSGHVTFKLRYNQIYQLKTTKIALNIIIELFLYNQSNN